jgi:hypothetical protein
MGGAAKLVGATGHTCGAAKKSHVSKSARRGPPLVAGADKNRTGAIRTAETRATRRAE